MSERKKSHRGGESRGSGNLNSHGDDPGLRPPDPPPPGDQGGGQQPSERRSYAAAASGERKPAFPVIALPRRQAFNKDGKPAIFFTPAEIGACTRQMEHALIAKFSNGWPHVSVIEREFRNSWKVEGSMTVSDMDGRHILVILASEQDVISALTRAPRRVGTSLFRLFKWTPEFHFKQESTIITIWVRFPHLRPDLFNEGVLRCLCQPFGRFLDSDSHTKQRTRCAFARCCVEVDITKALPHEIWIDAGDGHGWWQEIEYEGNLKYCSKCRIHGHILSECRKAKLKPQIKAAEQRAKVQGEPGQIGLQSSQPFPMQQEWIQVRGRKHPNPNRISQNAQLEEGPMEGTKVGEPSPEGKDTKEIDHISISETEEDQGQSRIVLKKSNSEANMAKQLKEEDKNPFAYLTRSQSMNDIPGNCPERRIEYLREEFHHFHLIDKHLKKTKEETLRRLRMMEQRSTLNDTSPEESQQVIGSHSQGEIGTIVPETQLDRNKPETKGDPSQKKLKSGQSANKPLTRAAKKHKSPKKK